MRKIELTSKWITSGSSMYFETGLEALRRKEKIMLFRKLELIDAFPSIGLQINDSGLYAPKWYSDQEVINRIENSEATWVYASVGNDDWHWQIPYPVRNALEDGKCSLDDFIKSRYLGTSLNVHHADENERKRLQEELQVAPLNVLFYLFKEK